MIGGAAVLWRLHVLYTADAHLCRILIFDSLFFIPSKRNVEWRHGLPLSGTDYCDCRADSRAGRVLRTHAEQKMSSMVITCGLAAVGVFAYLVYALFNAEDF